MQALLTKYLCYVSNLKSTRVQELIKPHSFRHFFNNTQWTDYKNCINRKYTSNHKSNPTLRVNEPQVSINYSIITSPSTIPYLTSYSIK